MTSIALLRGINVGGKNRLPMADLRQIFEEAGCTDVRTYIQSGNVVYEAPSGVDLPIDRIIAGAIEERLGLRVPVVLVGAEQFAAVVAGNPYVAQGYDPKTLYVAFLAGRVDDERLAALDPDRSPPDTFVAFPRHIYLHMPNGVARTKLTSAYLDGTLGTISTARNWRTVSKLLEMTRGS